jgi:glycosyltransferase involved in cell wall biosynthesis
MKKVLFIFKEGTERGGPTISHKRIINSYLKNEFDFSIIKIPKGKFSILLFFKIFTILKQIKKIQPDIIHIIGLELIGFYSSLVAFLYKKAKIIMGIHGSSEESTNHKIKRFKILFLKHLQFLTLLMVDKFYTVSIYTSKFNVLKKFHKKNFGVIYNIIEIPNKLGVNQFSYNQNLFYVLSMGRIEIEKGFSILTKIIKNSKNKDVFFIVVGEGSYLPTMKNELSKFKNVYFSNFLENPSYFLKNSDLFVLPSFHETFGMALAEAGLMGLPLLASKVGGIPEIIEDGFNGFMLESHDHNDYLEKIDWFYYNERKTSLLGKNSTILISQKFSKVTSIEQIKQLYESSL